MSDTHNPAPEGGRYYTPEGVLVEGATAKTAKRDGLYPSVTTLAYELAEPYGLKQARERLIAHEAVNQQADLDPRDRDAIPVFPGNEWADMIRDDAVSEWQEAAQRGREMHARIARCLEAEPEDLPPEVNGFLDTIADVVEVELVMVNHTYGYAGTCDLVCRLEGKLCISFIDFKTQGVKQGRPLWYPEWRRQLAAYTAAYAEGADFRGHVMNVVISTAPDTEGQVWLKNYTPKEMQQAWRTVRLAAALWWNARKVADSDLPPGVRDLLT